MTADPALAAVRVLTYGFGIWLFGRTAFPWLMTRARPPADALSRILALAYAAAAVGYVLLLARQVGASDVGDVWQLVAGTGFGRALAVAAIAALALAAAPSRGPQVRVELAGVALAALAFVGHAADGTGPRGWLRLAMMALHLLSIGTWIGALPSLLMALGRAEAPNVLRRFSVVAGLALGVVLGTGLISLTFVVVDARGALGPTYARALVTKLLFVAGLIALAVLNRFALSPRVAGGPRWTLTALRASIVAEQALGLCAIVAVAILGQLDPTM
jgi:putative copper resistance protein D